MLKMFSSLDKNAVFDRVDSPVGSLLIIASDKGVHSVLWEDELKNKAYKAFLDKLRRNEKHQVIVNLKKQLKEYFLGKRKNFDLNIVIEGTEFQKKAWKQLLKIPYGKTISYGEQARMLGDAKKARAVGMANSKNPVSIIVPCHRVIGKDGSLTGFGGGINNKKILIELEKNNI
ncbi:MAG: methylated-DNA--[protein]-cysteine S-methyltransferase [bacterium]